MYISHMRSEGNSLLEAVDELIRLREKRRCLQRLSPQGCRRTELAKDGCGDREGRGGASGGAAHHG